MNLPDLKAFVALAETGSINRAALRLGLTQPATTRRIQNFEASMAGTALLSAPAKADTAAGEALFKSKCAGCHGADGIVTFVRFTCQ